MESRWSGLRGFDVEERDAGVEDERGFRGDEDLGRARAVRVDGDDQGDGVVELIGDVRPSPTARGRRYLGRRGGRLDLEEGEARVVDDVAPIAHVEDGRAVSVRAGGEIEIQGFTVMVFDPGSIPCSRC